MARFLERFVLALLFLHEVSCLFFRTSSLKNDYSQDLCNGTCLCHSNLTVKCSFFGDIAIENIYATIPQNTTILEIANANIASGNDKPNNEGIIQESFTQYLPNITDLEIYDSRLINDTFFIAFPSLRKLKINNLGLSHFSFDQLKGLRDLEILDMSYNALTDLPEGAFEGLSRLVLLDLSHNKLTSLLNSDMFLSLTSLVSLNLSHNILDYVHPRVFHGLKALDYLHLEHNNLTSLLPETFKNLSRKAQLYLGNNPWNCHCGIEWIVEKIQAAATYFSDVENLICDSPAHLNSLKLMDLNTTDLYCEHPSFQSNQSIVPQNITIHFMQSGYLHCLATGDPKPSIYWIGPRGVLVHPFQQKWFPHDVLKFSSVQSWAGQPTYFNATVTALENGSLHFHNFRFNFDGSYTCVAVNPMGQMTSNATVTVKTNMVFHLIWSVLFGGFCGAIMLMIGIMIGSSYWIAERTCCKKDAEESAIEHYYSEDIPQDTEGFADSYFSILPYEYPDPTSRQSPMKCVTPAELLDAEENRTAFDAGILQTLDDVRTSLRSTIERQMEWMRSQRDTVRDSGRQLKTNVGKKVDRVKYKAQMIQQSSSSYVHSIRESGSTKLQSIRESGTVKLQSIKDSGSTKLKTIRSSSSHYALRVKTGMADRVEAVRGQVKSLKEFCGTGDIGQTVSVMSVSTNVDSQEKYIEYKCHTLV